MWSLTKRIYGIFWNGTSLPFLGFDWFDGFVITKSIVVVPKLLVLFDEGLDDRKLISKKFLVFGTVVFIISPLFQRDISADKENKLADLAILFLNDGK